MELRSGYVASSAASTPPQGEESQAQTGPATSFGPSTLPSQISASEAVRIIESDVDDDTELLAIADTLISLRAPPTYLPPPLPVQSLWANSAPSPAGIGRNTDLTIFTDTISLHSTTVKYWVSITIEICERQNNGYYAIQGHSRSSRSVPIESPYATSY